MADDERPFLAATGQSVSVNSLMEQLENEDEVFDSVPRQYTGMRAG
jgi:hypothetical protein